MLHLTFLLVLLRRRADFIFRQVAPKNASFYGSAIGVLLSSAPSSSYHAVLLVIRRLRWSLEEASEEEEGEEHADEHSKHAKF